MYYRLDDTYAFRGWKKLPYALRVMDGAHAFDRPRFYGRDDFLTLLACDGETPVCVDALPEPQQDLLAALLSDGVLTCSESPMEPLASCQRYRLHPSVYFDSIHWMITGKCNYRCLHCQLSAPSGRHAQLPLSDCLRIIDQMHLCGVRQVELTGGEPLLRPDFPEIVRALSAHGIRITRIYTNGSLLNASVLDGLLSAEQDPSFQLSFDGLGHHAWLRGVPEAEDDVIAACRLLHARNIRYSCAMCLHRQNADSLKDTARFLAENGCAKLRINTPLLLGEWQAHAESDALSRQEAWDLFKGCIPAYFEAGMPLSLELGGYFSCKKGSAQYKVPFASRCPDCGDPSALRRCSSLQYSACIDAEGRLLPCAGFSDAIPVDRFLSVPDAGLGSASLAPYYTDVVHTTIRQMLARNPECRDCAYLARCGGGCPITDVDPDGGLLRPDPDACWFFRNVGEAAVREIADAAIERYAPDARASEAAEA